MKGGGSRSLVTTNGTVRQSRGGVSRVTGLVLTRSRFPCILFLRNSGFLARGVSVEEPSNEIIALRCGSKVLGELSELASTGCNVPVGPGLYGGGFIGRGSGAVVLRTASVCARKGNSE